MTEKEALFARNKLLYSVDFTSIYIKYLKYLNILKYYGACNILHARVYIMELFDRSFYQKYFTDSCQEIKY